MVCQVISTPTVSILRQTGRFSEPKVAADWRFQVAKCAVRMTQSTFTSRNSVTRLFFNSMSSWLLRRLIPRSRTTNSISNNDIPRENDPDVTVTAASGPDGTSLATYRLHRSMLVSHSHYFKGIFTQSPHTGVLDVCSLPVTDTNRVFPYIIRYMYTHSVDFDEENYVHVCWLALRLGMAQVFN